MEKKHLIILSFDAFSSRDLDAVKDLPGFSRLMKDASFSKNVHSIYPSNTYPCHTSIATGMLPKNHGVVSNTLLQIGRKHPDWNWTRDRIKTDTFYDAAIRKGMTVASLLWPVTGKSRIQYNLPEIFANRAYKTQASVSLLNGTPLYILDLERRFGHLRKGKRQPELDLFVEASARYTLKVKKPDIMMVHFVELDAMRHKYGYDSDEAKRALRSLDRKLAGFFRLLDEEKITDSTTLMVLGDHDQIPVHTAIHLNSVLKDKGIIRTRGGRITDWDAYAMSQDGSAYIYMKGGEDEVLKEKVHQILLGLKNRPDMGIEAILSREEIDRMGADKNAAFMAEAKKGFFFSDDHRRPAQVRLSEDHMGSDHHGLSTHGYHPDKEDYQTIFFAWGRGIKKNVEIPHMRLIDEGPTFAALLGTALYDTDGRVLEEILL